MKLVNHGAKLKLWELDTERSRIYETVHRSGLAPLTSCSHRVVSRPMLSAFCERWQQETMTFHLPFGEMTITLDLLCRPGFMSTFLGCFLLRICRTPSHDHVHYVGGRT